MERFWIRCRQFSLRSIVLLTLGSAAMLAALLGCGPLGSATAALLWLMAGSLIGALDYRAPFRLGAVEGPFLSGALGGGLAGLLWALIGSLAAGLGYVGMYWPGPSVLFWYWWVASGVFVGLLTGNLAHSFAQLFTWLFATDAPAEQPVEAIPASSPWAGWQAVGDQVPSWFTSAYLHMLAAVILSFTLVGFGSGRLPSDSLASEPLITWETSIGDQPESESAAPLTIEPTAATRDAQRAETQSLTPMTEQPPQQPAKASRKRPLQPSTIVQSPSTPPPGELRRSVAPEAPPLPPLPPPSNARVTTQELERYTALLSHPQLRHEAQVWLMSRHQRTTEDLKKVYVLSSPAVQQELDRVLASFRPGAGAGGLKITLLADKSVVKLHEDLNLTILVRNTLDEPLNLVVGRGHYSQPADICFTSASVLCVRNNLGQPVPPSLNYPHMWCGTGLGPICAVVPAGECLVYRVECRRGGEGYNLGLRGHWLSDQIGNPHRLVVVYEVARDLISDAYWRHGTYNPGARCWTGKAVSNDLVVRSVP